MSESKCPLCGSSHLWVIYYGLPHLLCEGESCGYLNGPWNWLTKWLPFNGEFMVYEGGYCSALWAWLTQPETSNDD